MKIQSSHFKTLYLCVSVFSFFIDFVDGWLHLSIARASSVLHSVRAAILHSSFFTLPSSFLKPSVEPTEEGALPEDAVLGLEHPVVLVGIDEKFGGNALHAGGIEG